MYDSVAQVFDKGLPSRFNADESEGESASYLFHIIDVGFWRVDINNKRLTIAKDETAPADVEVTVTEKDFLDLANGEETLQILFMSGQLTLVGDLVIALKMVRFFPER